MEALGNGYRFLKAVRFGYPRESRDYQQISARMESCLGSTSSIVAPGAANMPLTLLNESDGQGDDLDIQSWETAFRFLPNDKKAEAVRVLVFSLDVTAAPRDGTMLHMLNFLIQRAESLDDPGLLQISINKFFNLLGREIAGGHLSKRKESEPDALESLNLLLARSGWDRLSVGEQQTLFDYLDAKRFSTQTRLSAIEALKALERLMEPASLMARLKESADKDPDQDVRQKAREFIERIEFYIQYWGKKEARILLFPFLVGRLARYAGKKRSDAAMDSIRREGQQGRSVLGQSFGLLPVAVDHQTKKRKRQDRQHKVKNGNAVHGFVHRTVLSLLRYVAHKNNPIKNKPPLLTSIALILSSVNNGPMTMVVTHIVPTLYRGFASSFRWLWSKSRIQDIRIPRGLSLPGEGAGEWDGVYGRNVGSASLKDNLTLTGGFVNVALVSGFGALTVLGPWLALSHIEGIIPHLAALPLRAIMIGAAVLFLLAAMATWFYVAQTFRLSQKQADAIMDIIRREGQEQGRSVLGCGSLGISPGTAHDDDRQRNRENDNDQIGPSKTVHRAPLLLFNKIIAMPYRRIQQKHPNINIPSTLALSTSSADGRWLVPVTVLAMAVPVVVWLLFGRIISRALRTLDRKNAHSIGNVKVYWKGNFNLPPSGSACRTVGLAGPADVAELVSPLGRPLKVFVEWNTPLYFRFDIFNRSRRYIVTLRLSAEPDGAWLGETGTPRERFSREEMKAWFDRIEAWLAQRGFSALRLYLRDIHMLEFLRSVGFEDDAPNNVGTDIRSGHYVMVRKFRDRDDLVHGQRVAIEGPRHGRHIGWGWRDEERIGEDLFYRQRAPNTQRGIRGPGAESSVSISHPRRSYEKPMDDNIQSFVDAWRPLTGVVRVRRLAEAAGMRAKTLHQYGLSVILFKVNARLQKEEPGRLPIYSPSETRIAIQDYLKRQEGRVRVAEVAKALHVSIRTIYDNDYLILFSDEIVRRKQEEPHRMLIYRTDKSYRAAVRLQNKEKQVQKSRIRDAVAVKFVVEYVVRQGTLPPQHVLATTLGVTQEDVSYHWPHLLDVLWNTKDPAVQVAITQWRQRQTDRKSRKAPVAFNFDRARKYILGRIAQGQPFPPKKDLVDAMGVSKETIVRHKRQLLAMWQEAGGDEEISNIPVILPLLFLTMPALAPPGVAALIALAGILGMMLWFYRGRSVLGQSFGLLPVTINQKSKKDGSHDRDRDVSEDDTVHKVPPAFILFKYVARKNVAPNDTTPTTKSIALIFASVKNWPMTMVVRQIVPILYKGLANFLRWLWSKSGVQDIRIPRLSLPWGGAGEWDDVYGRSVGNASIVRNLALSRGVVNRGLSDEKKGIP